MILFLKKLRTPYGLLFIVVLAMTSCHAYKKVDLQEPPKEENLSDDKPTNTLIVRHNESKIDRDRKTLWQYTQTKLSSGEGWSDVKFIDQNVGWAWSDKTLYKTSDVGKTWRKIIPPLSKGDQIAAMEFATEKIGWLAIEDFNGEEYLEYYWKSKILFTQDGGESWSIQYQGDGLGINQIHFINEKEGWIGGGKYWKTPTWKAGSFFILHTNDQGQTWEEVIGDLTRYNEETYHYLDWMGLDNHSKIAFSDNRERLFHTLNKGKSWEQIAQFPEELPQDLFSPFAILEDGRIWAHSGADSIEGMWGRVALMSNDKSWDVFTINETVFISDAILLEEGEIVASGSRPKSKNRNFDFGNREGLILHSQDGGKSWGIIYHSNKVEWINSLVKIDAGHFVAFGENGVVCNFVLEEKK